MDFKDSIKTCLKEKYASFSGRASRSEFWFFYLFGIAVYGICILLAVTISFKFLWVLGIFALGVFIPALEVTWRRLHDINKSGMYFFLPVPFAIIEVILNSLSSSRETNESISILFILVDLGVMLYLLILYCTDGDKKNNRFGKNIYLKKKKKRKIKATR